MLGYLVALGCLLPVAEPLARVVGAEDAVRSRGAAPVTAADVESTRHAVLLLNGGPLCLRLHVTLAGKSLTQSREELVGRLIRTIDADGDGKLTQLEASQSALLTTRRRSGPDLFPSAREAQRLVSRADILKTVERVGGETMVFRQDDSAAKNDAEVFNFLDADKSGLLEPIEMEAAGIQILARDQDGDECVSFDEFLPPPDPAALNPAVAQQPLRPDRPAATVSDMLRDASEPLLGRRLIRKYDANSDSELSAKELGWSDERIAGLDKDSDARLDLQELAGIAQGVVDAEIAVELAPEDSSKGSLRVVSASGAQKGEASRPDYVRLNFGNAVIDFSFRPIDPTQSAIANAMQQFNRLDVDANGYLDAMETSQRIRFERGLFDLVDADGDGKIFGEEMERYVTARGEPAATTCRVNLHDTGSGFFQTLDRNSDGRISMREMTVAPNSLKSMRRQSAEALSPSESIRHFHIEFVRGSFQLFGPSDQMLSRSPTFEERAPVGPIWFQRMDRNNDGDLSWNEFLGPRDIFSRLDADRDGLLDAKEAAAADK